MFKPVEVKALPFPLQRVQTDQGAEFCGGKTPWERYQERAAKVPSVEEIVGQYDEKKERWNVRPQKRRWVLRL